MHQKSLLSNSMIKHDIIGMWVPNKFFFKNSFCTIGDWCETSWKSSPLMRIWFSNEKLRFLLDDHSARPVAHDAAWRLQRWCDDNDQRV